MDTIELFADKDKKIATLPLGHADELIVNMEMVLVTCLSAYMLQLLKRLYGHDNELDVSNVSCERGDEVVVFDSIKLLQNLTKS